MDNISFQIIVANPSHKVYSSQITDEMENSAKARGTGIAKRTPAYVETKMDEGK
ncbi:MAG: GNAT family N-acetyltransferase, partial [Algoriphagus sp.]